jgi:hypothetical protein
MRNIHVVLRNEKTGWNKLVLTPTRDHRDIF